MKKTTTKRLAGKLKRLIVSGLWGLFYLAKGFAETIILILAVSVTALCYVLASPFFLYLHFKKN